MKWFSRQRPSKRRPVSRLSCARLDDRIVPAGGPRAILELTPDKGSPQSINLDSFTFGFQRPVDFSSPLPSQARFDKLSASSLYVDNSPLLQLALASGMHYDSGQLTQLNEAGKTVAIWFLDTVFLSNMSTTVEEGRPRQNIDFQFLAMTEKTSTTSYSWDQTQSKSIGPAIPAGLTLDPLPTPLNPSITIDFVPLPGSTNALPFSMPVDSYQFVSKHKNGESKSSFGELLITAPFQGHSPRAHRAMLTGSHYETAVLTQRNAAGNPVAAWSLGTVFIESDVIVGGDVMLTSSMSIEFGSMTTATSSLTKSWSVFENNATGPSLPAGLALSPLPTSASFVSLYLPAVSGSPAITIPIDSYRLAFESEVDIGSVGGGAGGGEIDFDTLLVDAPLALNSPQLFANLMADKIYPTASLIHYNSDNKVLAAWQLGLARIDQQIVTGGEEGPKQELSIEYVSITEATDDGSSWDIDGTPTGPSMPTSLKFAPLPSTPGPITLDLLPAVGTNLKAVSIDVDAFTFGFENDFNLAGSGNDPKFKSLKIEFDFANKSPYLLSAMYTGVHFGSGTLTQRDSSGNAIVAWQLDTIYVASDEVVSEGGLPRETISIEFFAMTEATATSQFTWNQTTNTPTGPALPSGLNLSAFPTVPATAISLELVPPPGQSWPQALTLPVSDFEFGFKAESGKGKFDELRITTLFSTNTPRLDRAIFVNSPPYASAILKQRNSTGQVVLAWVMGDVFVTTDSITAGGGVPSSAVTFEFLSVTEATSAYKQSWNQVINDDIGPAWPVGLVLSPLPIPPTETRMTLKLEPSSGPDVLLPINSFSFGIENTATVGSVGGGAGTGKAVFHSLEVDTDLVGELPLLFNKVLSSSTYQKGTLFYYNSSHKAAAGWAFGPMFPELQQVIGSDGLPTHRLSFSYSSLTTGSSTMTYSWNQATNSANGPVLTFPMKAAPLIDPPAKVLTTIVNDGGVQRSKVNQLAVEFSTAVRMPNNPADAFTLTGPNGTIPLSVTLSGESSTTAKIAFNDLSDGRYTLQIDSQWVWDVFYQDLDGDNNGTAGGNYTFNFHRLFGDANGNARVDSDDFSVLRTFFGTSNGIHFDADNDGVVDSDDFNEFRKRFGIVLP